jgi:Fe-S-cluster containining protein
MKPCDKCGVCCKTNNEYAVILFPEDVAILSAWMGISARDFLEVHCVFRTVNGHRVYYLKKERKDQCRFLEGKLCKVYPCRPAQCRLAPYAFFTDYQNWSHVPCITDEETYNREKQDSAESDRALLETIVRAGYDSI